MRQRRKIAASFGSLAFVLLGYACLAGGDEAGSPFSFSDAPAVAYTARSNAQPLLSREAVCAVTGKARESFSDGAWANDPADMYVRSLSRDERGSTSAKGSTLLDVSGESSADKDASRPEVTSGAAPTASADVRQHADQATYWRAIVVPVAAGAVVLVLIGLLLLFGRHRHRGSIPHAALFNLPANSPTAQTIAPTSAPATEKRRAA